jgi:selenide,water dikinase
MKRLLLVGGGHSHVEVLRRFALDPLPGLEIVLVSPNRFTPYSGMLPGLVAGHYRYEQCHIDLAHLSERARARFVTDRVTGLDLHARRAGCEGGEALAYDVVSLDIGSTPPLHGLAGAREHALGVKPVEDFLRAWSGIRATTHERLLQIVVIGGGAGGVELTLAMQHQVAAEGGRARFTIVTDSKRVLPGHVSLVRRSMEAVLAQRDVSVRQGRATVVEPGGLRLDSGDAIAADAVVLATGAAAPAWLRESGLETDAAGFVLIEETLNARTHPEVFAAGDVATMVRHPRPKSGVFAVRQGPPLADNLRRALSGETLQPFVPQRVALALISTGDKYAIASWGPLAWKGAWVWRWKDHIDRKFMRRYGVAA